jgi:hypothetical protein
MLVSELLENSAEVCLALGALDPLGLDPHPLDALLHCPGNARLGPGLEKLLCLVTLLIGGELKRINNVSSV